MKARHGPVDWSVPFDNVGTGYSSTNVHDAILETKNTAEGLQRFSISSLINSTVGSSAWIARSELMASPRILFPIACKLLNISWVNNNINLGGFRFEIYKNGQLAGNLVYTYTPTSGELTAGFGYISFTGIDFASGDSMFVKHVRPSGGTALSDLVLDLWFRRI
jgi:hypothetical protein